MPTVGPFFGGANLELGGFSIVLTVFASVTLINAIKIIDFFNEPADPPAFLCIIIGAIGGFLLFNMRLPCQARARSFLGDVGSLMLGFGVSWFLIDNSRGLIDPITAVWFVDLSLVDLCCVMTMPLRRSVSPLRGDRQHFHHLLLRSGCTSGQICGPWLCCAGCFMVIGALTQSFGVPAWLRLIGALVGLLVYALLIRRAWCRLATRFWRYRSTAMCRGR